MARPIRMDYFTDPYCAWSWAFQPTLEALLWSEELEVHYHQVPLILNLLASGKSPEDIAKAWEKVGRVTSTPINPEAWRRKPPESTVPACLASKAAEVQGPDAEGRFLKALRLLLMTEGRVADDPETLLKAAKEAELDLDAFSRALDSAELERSLRGDRELARQHGVEVTPAVLLRNATGDKILIQGPRDLELFRRAIAVLRAEDEAILVDTPVRIVATPLLTEATTASLGHGQRVSP